MSANGGVRHARRRPGVRRARVRRNGVGSDFVTAAHGGDLLLVQVDDRHAVGPEATEEVAEARNVDVSALPLDHRRICDVPAVLEHCVSLVEVDDRWQLRGLPRGLGDEREPDDSIAQYVGEHTTLVGVHIVQARRFTRGPRRDAHRSIVREHEVDEAGGQPVLADAEIVGRQRRTDRRDQIDLARDRFRCDDRLQFVVVGEGRLDEERQPGERGQGRQESPRQQFSHRRNRTVGDSAQTVSDSGGRQSPTRLAGPHDELLRRSN